MEEFYFTHLSCLSNGYHEKTHVYDMFERDETRSNIACLVKDSCIWEASSVTFLLRPPNSESKNLSAYNR